MISQTHITSNTPMGANLVPDGATFRAWAPSATAVYVNGNFGGVARTGQSDDLRMLKDTDGYWAGFVSGAKDGDLYRFYVVGTGSSGWKRDPYAREMARDAGFPECSCVIRPGSAYPWHDGAFVTPDFSNMILYQLHIGTYAAPAAGTASSFLDVIEKIEYLVALGVNVLQPLPIDEVEANPSLGYNGTDYFSPDFPYVINDAVLLDRYLGTINRLLKAKGRDPITRNDIGSAPSQFKAMIDLCHIYGIAVVLDVVYNHAGGFDHDDHCLYFWDRQANGNNNNSLYFTDQDRGTGGLSFALWKRDVRQFLINNALFYIQEFHVDGFRYDEVSLLVDMNANAGWGFCQDLTSTVRVMKPRAIQNAEFWPVNRDVVKRSVDGGADFDVTHTTA